MNAKEAYVYRALAPEEKTWYEWAGDACPRCGESGPIRGSLGIVMDPRNPGKLREPCLCEGCGFAWYNITEIVEYEESTIGEVMGNKELHMLAEDQLAEITKRKEKRYGITSQRFSCCPGADDNHRSSEYQRNSEIIA